MKKLITIITLIAFINAHGARPANAALPLIIWGIPAAKWAVGGSLLLHASVAGLLYYFSRGDGGNGTVSADGTKAQAPASVTWVDLNGPGGMPMVNTESVVMQVPGSALSSAARANAGALPNLNNASYEPLLQTDPGSVVPANGTNWRVVQVNKQYNVGVLYAEASVYGVYQPSLSYADPITGVISYLADAHELMNPYTGEPYTNAALFTVISVFVQATTDPADAPVMSDATPFQFGRNVQNNPQALDEIAKAIPYVDDSQKAPMATDDPANYSASPYTEKPAATKEQVEAKDPNYGANGPDTAGSSAPTVGSGGVITAGSSGGSGGSGGSTGGTTSGGTTGSGEYSGILGTISGTLTSIKDSITNFFGGSPTEPGSNGYDSGVNTPDKKDIPSLFDSIKNNSPLVSLARSVQITTSNEDPSIGINLYGQYLNFDLSRYASYLNAAGAALLSVSHIYAVFLIFRRED